MSDEEQKKHSNPQEDHQETHESAKMGDRELHEVHGALQREHDEPSEGMPSFPIGIIFLFGAIVFFCGAYLIQYSGNMDPFVFDETQFGGTGGGAAEAVAYDPIVAGKRVFTANCQTCHQANGQGTGPGGYPPLVKSSWVLKDEKKLVRVVLNGLTGPLELDGNSYNSTMTPFRDVLSDKQIAEVLSYIRNSWGNEASVIPESFVASIREETQDRSSQWTVEELQPWFDDSVDFGSGGESASSDSADSSTGGAGSELSLEEMITVGKKKYNLTCMACHQATGQGVPELYPSIVNSEIGQRQDAMAVRIILHGLKGPLADGSVYPTSMAPLITALEDEDIAMILTYTRNAWGNTGEAVSVATVAKIREEEKDRVEEWTLEELEAYRVE